MTDETAMRAIEDSGLSGLAVTYNFILNDLDQSYGADIGELLFVSFLKLVKSRLPHNWVYGIRFARSLNQSEVNAYENIKRSSTNPGSYNCDKIADVYIGQPGVSNIGSREFYIGFTFERNL
jgi:hypothetical protein